MALKVFTLLTLFVLKNVSALRKGEFVGCYQDVPTINVDKLHTYSTTEECTKKCFEAHYR